jgi:hypothetical protein
VYSATSSSDQVTFADGDWSVVDEVMERGAPGLDGSNGGVPPQVVKYSQFLFSPWQKSTFNRKFPAGAPIVIRGRLTVGGSGMHSLRVTMPLIRLALSHCQYRCILSCLNTGLATMHSLLLCNTDQVAWHSTLSGAPAHRIR